MRPLSKPTILFFLAVIPVMVFGCTNLFYNPDRSISLFFESHSIETPASSYVFNVCNHYDCEGESTIRMRPEEWLLLSKPFMSPSKNAAEERIKISEYVARMELFVGPQNNTFADQACNNFKTPIDSFQLDCIAETINTTNYLLLLEMNHLLRWHKVSYPASRDVAGVFFLHYTAVIKEIVTEQLFSVDSWFYPNGHKPVVVPLTSWQKNFYPPESCSKPSKNDIHEYMKTARN